jgi:hypothetical protein
MADRNIQYKGSGEIIIAAAAATLPFPPVEVADVALAWTGGAPMSFDLELWADAAESITDAELFGLAQFHVAIASDDVDTVDFANDELDIATHGLGTGSGPIQFTSTTTLPTGMDLATDYWVISVNAGTIQIALSLEDALEGTAVAFTDVGSGTHSLEGSLGDERFMSGSSNSWEVRWLGYGLLGIDGAIDLSAGEGYTTRVTHRPRTVAYGIVATYGGGANVSAQLIAVHGQS